MPAYSKLTGHDLDHPGRPTPITEALMRVLNEHDKYPHFAAVSTPGHMDKIDDGCASALGLNPEARKHLDEEWPRAQKELVRQAAIAAFDRGIRFEIAWDITRSRREHTTIEESGGVMKITFLAPRHKVVAAVKAKRASARTLTNAPAPA